MNLRNNILNVYDTIDYLALVGLKVYMECSSKFLSFSLSLYKMVMGSVACAQALIKLVCFPSIFHLLHLCNLNLTLSFNNCFLN